MKSYTNLEQSKGIAEILSPESADMYWWSSGKRYYIEAMDDGDFVENRDIRAWSLAALLDVLPKEIKFEGQHYAPCLFPVQDKWLLKLWYNSNYTITSPISIFSDNPTDACVAMIERLHKLKVL